MNLLLISLNKKYKRLDISSNLLLSFYNSISSASNNFYYLYGFA